MPRFRAPVISTANIIDGSITTPKLADGAVSSIKLATDIQSDNFVAGVSGWRILRNTGNAEFNDVTVRGTIFANAGEIGDLDVINALTMTAAGAIRTAATGRRIELRSTDASVISLITATAGENHGGLIYSIASGGKEQIVMASPQISNGGGVRIALNDSGPLVVESFDGPASNYAQFNQQIRVTDGSAAAPAIRRSNAADGIYFATGELRVGIGGTDTIQVADDYLRTGNQGTGQAAILLMGPGTADFPAFSFSGDNDTGVYRAGVNNIGLTAGTTSVFRSTSAATVLPVAAATTTASAANAWLNSSNGVLARSTSSARYKTGIRPWDRRASVLALTPSLYRSAARFDDGRRLHLGLIAEEVAAVFPIAAVLDPEGRPDAVEWNAVTAALIAEVATLAGRVADLESAR